MRCMLPFCACGTKSVSCELQRAFGAIKCFLKHFNGVQYDRQETANKRKKRSLPAADSVFAPL